MRLFPVVCLLVVASAAAVQSLHAQHLVALNVAPRTDEQVSVVARARAPGATLSSPLVAAIASDRIGIGVHLHLGVGIEEAFEGVYGASVDVPFGRGGRRPRLGFSALAVQGLSPSGGLDEQVACILGYAYGANMAGTIVRLEPRHVSSPRSMTLGWSVDASRTSLTFRANGGSTLEDRNERTASVGLSLPVVLSFRSGRRNSSTERDWRYQPYTTLFIEPGLSINELRANPVERGTLPHFSIGGSILEIGPGFGITAVIRKMLLGDRAPNGAISASFHARRKRGTPSRSPR